MVDETEFDIMDADHESRLTGDEFDQIPVLATEYRQVTIIMCPNCVNEWHENLASIKCGSIHKCPSCCFMWRTE